MEKATGEQRAGSLVGEAGEAMVGVVGESGVDARRWRGAPRPLARR
jgi:hypothetical protein